MSSPRNGAAAARRRHTELLASALDAVVGMDAEGLIVSWNARAEEMFGWSAAEAVGQPMHASSCRNATGAAIGPV